MNKNRVDKLLPLAAEALKDVGIAVNGEIASAFRSQISSFGSAVKNGSLLSAVAFFRKQGKAKVAREKLLEAINNLMSSEVPELTGEDLFDKVKSVQDAAKKTILKEQILDCVIALKLAMNLYDLK